MANWWISNIWNWYCYYHRPSFFGPQKFFYQVFHQFHHFSYKLHRITVTYYIIDRKAKNFNRISDFVVTIAIATCGSLCVCISSASTFFMAYLLSMLCLLCLRLLYLGELFALSAFSVACFVCVFCALLRLRLPWLALFVFAICVLSAPSASAMHQ